MNRPWHLTVDVIDGERYLSADEAETRLYEIITNIAETEKHWDALRGIDPGLQVAASVYHPEMSAKLWATMSNPLKRAAIQSEDRRATIVKNVVRAVMSFYVWEDQMT